MAAQAIEKGVVGVETPAEYKIDYNQTFKIELLNEFSNGVYARLLNFILKNEIDTEDKSNFYLVLKHQFVVMLDLKLYEMSIEEIEVVENYWKSMHKYVKELQIVLGDKKT